MNLGTRSLRTALAGQSRARIVGLRLLIAALLGAGGLSALTAPSALAGTPDVWTHWINPDESDNSDNDASWVYSLDYVTPTELAAATNGNGIFQATSPQTSWNPEISGLAPYDKTGDDAWDTYDVYNNGSMVYAATGEGLFSATAGSSLSWKHLGDEPAPAADQLTGISTEAVLAESASDLIVGVSTGGESGVYTSSDGGSTWKPATSMPANEDVYSLAQGAGSTVYAAGSSGVWTSFDGGASWNLTSNGLDTADQFFRVYTTSTSPSEVWASTGSHLYHSTNGGVSWTIADGTGPESLPAGKKWGVIDSPSLSGCSSTTLSSNPLACNDVFVGTSQGVYLSPDDGTTWGQMSPNSVASTTEGGEPGPEGTGQFGNRSVFSLALGGDTLTAGTQGWGAYWLGLTPVTSSGTATESSPSNLVPGDTLTANSTWSGSLPYFITYQWRRCTGSQSGTSCPAISGAIGATYTVPNADVPPAGVSYDVTSCSTNVLQPVPVCTTSAKSGTVGAIPGTEPHPITDGNPGDDASVSGGSGDGSDPFGTTYTINPGEWGTVNSPGVQITPTSYGYQWQRCATSGADAGDCTVILGATAASYTTTKADVGDDIDAFVQATDASGSSAFYLAGQIDQVIEPTPVDTGAAGQQLPQIVGSPYVGETLQGADGLWTADDPTYSQVWYRCDDTGEDCDPIYDSQGDVEDGNTYTLTEADVGSEIELYVEADQADVQDRIGYATSAPTAVITDPPPGTPITTAPTPSPVAPIAPPTAPPTLNPTPTPTTTTTTTPTPTPAPTTTTPTEVVTPKAPVVGALRLVVSHGTAKVEFKLTGAGSAAVKLERLIPGHQTRRGCVTGRRPLAKRCSVIKVVAVAKVKVPKTGTVVIALPTRIGGRKLPGGNYEVVATPISTAGTDGKARTLTLVLT